MNRVILLTLILFSTIAKSELLEFQTGNNTILTSTEEAGLLLLNEIGKTQIEVIDKDKDGNVDLLRFRTFNENGKELLEVEDNNLDGTLDQRWHKTEPSYFEIWHKNTWRRVYKSELGLFIKTENGNEAVINNGGRLEVHTHNK